MSATRFIRGACKCCCKAGDLLPGWQNISKVRPIGDSGGTHYTSTPYPRLDNTQSGCAGSPTLGSCGVWLMGGDINGISAQVIQDTVDDIMTCGAPDATHVTNDHNCYAEQANVVAGSFVVGDSYQILTVGTTNFTLIGSSSNLVGTVFMATGTGVGTGTAKLVVDMRAGKFMGGQWVLAKKFWHGTFGFTSNDSCARSPNVVADQVKYLTFTIDAVWNVTSYVGTDESLGTFVTEKYEYSGNYHGTNSVNSKTGIRKNSLTMGQLKTYMDANVPTQTFYESTNGVGWTDPTGYPYGTKTNILSNMLIQEPNTKNPPMHGIGEFMCSSMTAFALLQNIYANGFTFEVNDSSGNPLPSVTIPVVGTVNNWSVVGKVNTYVSGDNLATFFLFEQSVNVTFVRTNTQVTYIISYDQRNSQSRDIGETYSAKVTASLSDPYTATDCYGDFLNALGQWDMSNFNMAGLRTDEELANAPLILYDEIGPIGPDIVYQFTIDNYAGGLITDANGVSPGGMGYVTTWNQIAWIDPANYIWKAPDHGFNNVPGTGGCTLITPMRTGAIISHTQAGSERHFWYGYISMQRELISCGGGATGYEWFFGYRGGFSGSPLPATSMRWMDNLEAQYDGLSGGCSGTFVPPPGNFPQAFWNQHDGKVVGGKYVAAVQKWNSVNLGRPCGPDKYAVDQTTVGCITGAGAGTFTVTKPSSTSVAFPGSGYVIVTGSFGTPGVYAVTGVSGTGPWTISVGPLLDGLPTGYSGGNIIGYLRFPTASGICGRAAITTTYSGGTLTINTAGQPYLRIGATGSILIDLYDSTMTLLASGISLTRVNDGQFTSVTSNYSTAVYMVGHGIDWTKYNTTPHQTGVHLDWSFNQREAQPGFIGPPTWYAGVGGCTGCTITQFTYPVERCLAIVGIVPFYSLSPTGGMVPVGSGSPPSAAPVEHFPNEELFQMPDTVIFDDIFGAHWQGAVMLTMPDPFWQKPFTPDCGGSIQWFEDDGSGNADSGTNLYFAHHPMVEATTSSAGLPAGIKVTYDPTNQIAPPFYPNGIPIGDVAGGYGAVQTDWGFAARACADILASGRFSTTYSQFVFC